MFVAWPDYRVFVTDQKLVFRFFLLDSRPFASYLLYPRTTRNRCLTITI